MPFCRYCGKELSEGETCSCTTPVAANDPVVQESSASGYDPAFGGNKPFTVKKDISLRNKLLILGGAVITLALLVVLVIFIINHTGSRGAARKFSKCIYDSDGGRDYYSMTLPDDLYDKLKGNKLDAMVDEFNDANDEIKDDYKIKLKKVKKDSKLSDKELDGAEVYFRNNAVNYDRSYKKESFKAKKGYVFKLKYKIKDKQTKKTKSHTTEVALVYFKGEKWKVLCPELDGDESIKSYCKKLGGSDDEDDDDDDDDDDDYNAYFGF